MSFFGINTARSKNEIMEFENPPLKISEHSEIIDIPDNSQKMENLPKKKKDDCFSIISAFETDWKNKNEKVVEKPPSKGPIQMWFNSVLSDVKSNTITPPKTEPSSKVDSSTKNMKHNNTNSSSSENLPSWARRGTSQSIKPSTVESASYNESEDVKWFDFSPKEKKEERITHFKTSAAIPSINYNGLRDMGFKQNQIHQALITLKSKNQLIDDNSIAMEILSENPIDVKEVQVDSKMEIENKIQVKAEIKKESSEDSTCVICMERQRNVVLLPCGHFGFCDVCAANISDCPICRTKTNGFNKVFTV